VNRCGVLIIAAVQMITICAVARAQTEPSSATALPACIPPGAAIAKRESRPPCPPQNNTPGFGIQISGRLDVLSKTEAFKTLVDDGVLAPDKPPDTEKISSALKKVLASHGYPNAQVQFYFNGQVLTVSVDEGERLPLTAIHFEGNKIFPESDLLASIRKCLKQNGMPNEYDIDKLQYCKRQLENHIRNFGYLQASVIQKDQLTAAGYVVSFTVDEGALYRLGQLTIKGQRALTEEQIRSKLTLREGDFASADKISIWLFQDLKNDYGEMGFIQYTAEPVPTFKREQGIVDFDIEIDEGQQFSLKSIDFVGDLIDRNVKEVLVNQVGEVYNQRRFRESIAILNASGRFAPVDPDKDVEFRTDDEDALVSVVIKLNKRQ
jgi:outer membrane protein assembly factor BamA